MTQHCYSDVAIHKLPAGKRVYKYGQATQNLLFILGLLLSCLKIYSDFYFMLCNMNTVPLQERSDMSVFARLKASGYVVAACPQLHPAAQHLLCPCCLQHDLTVMPLCPCCLQHDLTVIPLCPCCLCPCCLQHDLTVMPLCPCFLQHDLTVILLCPCCLCPCCLQIDLTVMPLCPCCVLAVYNMTLL